VWLGVSVEDQAAADARIPLLLETPAALRFLSVEPMLGPVDLGHCLCREWAQGGLTLGRYLDWVIVGGESGAGARPMHPDWVRGVRDQCVRAEVPFFFKQWGEWTPGENVDLMRGVVDTATWFNDRWIFAMESLAYQDGHVDDQPDLYRMGKKRAGALLDGRMWRQMPGDAGREEESRAGRPCSGGQGVDSPCLGKEERV
jgi:protein gp37